MLSIGFSHTYIMYPNQVEHDNRIFEYKVAEWIALQGNCLKACEPLIIYLPWYGVILGMKT